jgi:hypothetical protein
MRQLEQMAPLFGEQGEEALQQISDRMAGATERLEGKDPQRGYGEQKAALDSLEQLQQSMQQSQRGGGKGGLPLPLLAGGEQEGGNELSRQKVKFPTPTPTGAAGVPEGPAGRDETGHARALPRPGEAILRGAGEVRRAAAIAFLLLGGLAWATRPRTCAPGVRALEELLDEEDYVAARAELERLKQGNQQNESVDFFAGRVAFGEGATRTRSRRSSWPG